MSEIPVNPPIEDVVKSVLLSPYKRPAYVETLYANLNVAITGQCPQSPLPQEFVYEALWFGTSENLTAEAIKTMSKNEFSKHLSLMETEDQDELVKLLPGLSNEFWDLVNYGWNLVENENSCKTKISN